MKKCRILMGLLLVLTLSGCAADEKAKTVTEGTTQGILTEGTTQKIDTTDTEADTTDTETITDTTGTEEAAQKFTYTQISQDEAKEMMKRNDGHVIVDVRRKDEYDEGHIPGAILITNENIGFDPPAQLPDKDQIILVYCRSGRRSKEASEKLANMGYSRVYEFGGIIDWTGEIEKEP